METEQIDRLGNKTRASRIDSNQKRVKDFIPNISLPKSGGVNKCIGEKFAADPVTGSGLFTIPIPVSTARSEFAPQFSLSYDSGNGFGLYRYRI